MSRSPSVKRANQAVGVDLEGGEHPALPSRADADLDAASAQLVQRAQALGQVDRVVQRGDEHHAAQAYPLGAGGRVGHRLDRSQCGHRSQDLLLRPGAAEAERLGSPQVGAESGWVERAVSDELRDRDRISHAFDRSTIPHDASPDGIHSRSSAAGADGLSCAEPC
jgi:hypothetical protein